MKLRKETVGTYTIVNEDGSDGGMIQGDEHWTGKPRKWWWINIPGCPLNMTRTLKEAKEWAGVAPTYRA